MPLGDEKLYALGHELAALPVDAPDDGGPLGEVGRAAARKYHLADVSSSAPTAWRFRHRRERGDRGARRSSRRSPPGVSPGVRCRTLAYTVQLAAGPGPLARAARGAWLDVWITLISFALACVARDRDRALAHLRARALLRWPAFVYVQLVRGVPLLVFLYWVYFGVAIVARRQLHARPGGDHRAHRHGLRLHRRDLPRRRSASVDAGQVEAATALGFTRRSCVPPRRLPQALRIAVPPLGNIADRPAEGRDAVSVIGVADMVFVAQQINLDYFTPFEPFTAVAVILSSSSRCSPRRHSPRRAPPPPAVIAALLAYTFQLGRHPPADRRARHGLQGSRSSSAC